MVIDSEPKLNVAPGQINLAGYGSAIEGMICEAT